MFKSFSHSFQNSHTATELCWSYPLWGLLCFIISANLLQVVSFEEILKAGGSIAALKPVPCQQHSDEHLNFYCNLCQVIYFWCWFELINKHAVAKTFICAFLGQLICDKCQSLHDDTTVELLYLMSGHPTPPYLQPFFPSEFFCSSDGPVVLCK